MANTDPWVVHKFGGSSVADADCFRRVAAILDSIPAARLGVVLSACRGVTDALLRLVSLAERQDDSYRSEITALRVRHATIAETLLTSESARLYLAGFDRDCHDLEGILHTVKLTRQAAHNVVDLIAGYGEIWSTKLFHRFLEERGSRRGPVQWVDARRVVVVDRTQRNHRSAGRNRVGNVERVAEPGDPIKSVEIQMIEVGGHRGRRSPTTIVESDRF